MLTPVLGRILPEANFSKVQVEFICDCGNKIQTSWSSFKSGKAKSCGKCKITKWKTENRFVYGKMTLLTPTTKIERMTDLVSWKCDCGNEKSIRLISVVNGVTQSCGCVRKSQKKSWKDGDLKRREDWLKQNPDLLNEDLPEEWTSGTGRKFKFRCACGNIYLRKFNRHQFGKSNCGECHHQILKTGDEFWQLKYLGPTVKLDFRTVHTAEFSCKCGKKVLAKIGSVISGKKAKCGSCNVVEERRFGNLTMKEGQPFFSKGSDKKAEFICDCGNEHTAAFHSVANGLVRSCGRCSDSAKKWYAENKTQLEGMSFPISKNEPILSYLSPEKDIQGPNELISVKCPICDKYHETRFRYIRDGESLTCGCRSGKVSLAQHEIVQFIHGLKFIASVEYPVHGLKYDVFVPEANLLLEYHGLKWHSTLESKKRDFKKYENAIKSGYKFVCIFEDEWKYNRKKVENLISNRIGVSKPKSVRPSECQISKVTLEEADELYSVFHYIGPCKSTVNFGASIDGKLIACISFKRPTRQSNHEWELVRMVADTNYRIHGIWSKLLKEFAGSHPTKSIVSFSDNRLFQGGVYEKIGFRLDGEIVPDYYWCKNKRRYHKSGLRKKGEEKSSGLTETQIRESQGFKKIWDLGKKRWVWEP